MIHSVVGSGFFVLFFIFSCFFFVLVYFLKFSLLGSPCFITYSLFIFIFFLYISFFTLLFCSSVFFSLIFFFFFFFNIYIYLYIFPFLLCFSVVLCFFPFSFVIIFLNHFYQFVLFPCFILQVAHNFGMVFRLCVFVSFNPNCLISFLSSCICLVVFLLFVLFGSVFVSFVCVCFLGSVFICLIMFLPFLQGFVCIFFFPFFKYISVSTLLFCYSVFFPLFLFLFFISFLSVCFVSLLHSSVGTLLWFCFLFLGFCLLSS